MNRTHYLEAGRIYHVVCTRKGKFTGKLLRHDDTWATFEITAGRAGAMLKENERVKGEEVTVRQEFCAFSEVPQ